jgi:hypothetical protein
MILLAFSIAGFGSGPSQKRGFPFAEEGVPLRRRGDSPSQKRGFPFAEEGIPLRRRGDSPSQKRGFPTDLI